MLNPVAAAAMARLDTLTQCLGAVSDLMIPERDLHVVDRDRLAILLDFLARECSEARECFTQAIRTQ